MRARILSHWFGWYHDGQDVGRAALEAMARGCTHGIEHRGELVAVLLPSAEVGPVAIELENDDGEPVATEDCDYCGDDGYTDRDVETDCGPMSMAFYCEHCVKGIVDRHEAAHHRTTLPPSIAAFLNSQLEQ